MLISKGYAKIILFLFLLLYINDIFNVSMIQAQCITHTYCKYSYYFSNEYIFYLYYDGPQIVAIKFSLCSDVNVFYKITSVYAKKITTCNSCSY